MEIAEPITVRCSALVFRTNTVLLCHRVPGDRWVVPGGSPRRQEGAAQCAAREVRQETGLDVTPERVAFVLDATSPEGKQHLFEIVFLAREHDPSAVPRGGEDGLEPSFVDLGSLDSLALLPDIGRRLACFADTLARTAGEPQATAAYLGNVWQPLPDVAP
ncbi:MAG TPA: NUDIX hydrolase [Acidimicrobiales bacterium]|nr:NUDIX hydrolase [Acidimicrobiales bacterium]